MPKKLIVHKSEMRTPRRIMSLIKATHWRFWCDGSIKAKTAKCSWYWEFVNCPTCLFYRKVENGIKAMSGRKRKRH